MAKASDESANSLIVELGTAVLERALDDDGLSNLKDRQVRLVLGNTLSLDKARTPDIALVPSGVGDEGLSLDNKFDWRRMLCAIQVCSPTDARGTKRKHSADDAPPKEPPSKRSRSRTAKDVSSEALPAVEQDNTGDSGGDNQRTTKTDRDHTESESSTAVSASRWSPNATLCQDSVESKLLDVFRDAFSAHGDRSFAIGACVDKTRIKLMFVSRSGIVESNEIDFLRSPESFATFLLMFATLPLPRLGFNAATGFYNPFDVDDQQTRRVNVQLDSFDSDNNQKDQPDLSDVYLDRKIVAHSGVVGRSTAVYRLKHSEYAFNLVIKYSWQVKTHRREDEIIRSAREADPFHTPELFGTAIVEDDSPFESLRNACSYKSRDYEPRELRVLVMREYRLLSELGFGDEFWDAFAQLVGCEYVTLLHFNSRTHAYFR